MARKWKEEWKVYENVFDNYTYRNLFKLQSQGYFESLLSPISVGKEANVFSAITKDQKLVIVKIYRLQTCNFNKMYDYIKLDPRYEHLKKQRRKIIFAWTQREYRNLMIARDAGIRVPTPLTFLDNILVLEFIGDSQPALQMKDHVPTAKRKYFDRIVEYIKKYWKAGFVHGDLSSFNILTYKNEPTFIDFSQATTIKSHNSKELLERDVYNIVTFAKKYGLKLDKDKIIKNIIL